MGWLDKLSGTRKEFDSTHHGSVTHDLLGAAIAYEATKAYEEHCAKNGKPDSHAKAKEILAGFAAAAATHLVETKGLDAWDAHKQAQARTVATEQINEYVVNEYNNYS